MITIPQHVMDFVKLEARNKGFIKVDITILDKDGGVPKSSHGLTFTRDLVWFGMDGYVISIEDYLSKTLTYSRKPITVALNGKLLTDIHPPVALPQPTPPEINLRDTKHDNSTDLA